MNIYILYYQPEFEYGVDWILLHKEKYSSEEFKSLVQEVMDKHDLDIARTDLVATYLCDEYGFFQADVIYCGNLDFEE